MRNIDCIVIHTTATPQNSTIASIQRYWREHLKWVSPGYHHIIPPHSPAVRLAKDDLICNGVKGYNATSIHISYIGGIDSKGKPVDNRTPNQISELIRLLKHYKALYPNAKILGHRDFPHVNKACPCFDVEEWLQSVDI